MTFPAIALRGLCVLPGMVVHFDASRKKSVQALESSMVADQRIFLVAQRSVMVEDPSEEDVFEYGTICKIKQLVKMPGGIVRVVCEGLERAYLNYLETDAKYLIAEVEERPIEPFVEADDLTQEAMSRILKEELEDYCEANQSFSRDLAAAMLEINDLEELLYEIGGNLPLSYESKQHILDADSVAECYVIVEKILSAEAEINKIKAELQEKVKNRLDKNQRDYVLREQMKLIREELGEDTIASDCDKFEEQIKKMKASRETKEAILKEVGRYRNMPPMTQEAYVSKNYIETLLELPWKKMTKENKDLTRAERILEEDHYGLEKVKERILEYLAVRTLNGKGESPILCLVGPPGTGKTSIAQSIARSLERKYVRVCLGGVRDEAEIRGHRRTYVGAMPGRIATALKQAGTANPLMLLDEVDKLGSDYKGDPSSALLEILDSAQNDKFRDHFVELPIDLSEVLFLATANTLDTIPKPLLDRMEIIEISSYTENEKFHIAKKYLLPKQCAKNGLSAEQISVSDSAVKAVIHNYTREAGVRSLERKFGDLCRKAAKEILGGKKQVKIGTGNLEKFLGPELVTYNMANESDEVGIVRGLAWTSVGGDTLEIEVNLLPGNGKLELTGKLGEVMKESAQAALSYVRSVAEAHGIGKETFSEHDIHIHIPEGAVPKDGPSAGITMATAIMSAVTDQKVKADLAMTGEVTIRGRVLPIGGLKEKLLAAKMAGIHKVLVPDENRKNVGELSGEIVSGIEIQYVKTMNEVLDAAFVR